MMIDWKGCAALLAIAFVGTFTGVAVVKLLIEVLDMIAKFFVSLVN